MYEFMNRGIKSEKFQVIDQLMKQHPQKICLLKVEVPQSFSRNWKLKVARMYDRIMEYSLTLKL